ncbi:MAG TPA: VOC family protein [Gemmatimonadaceae bacterium]
MTTTASASPATTPLDADALSASLTVRDLAASRDWYRDALGFAIDREIERDGVLRAVGIRAGAVRLMLNQDDGAKGLDRAKGAGLSLMITTRQDIDAIAARVRARGTPFITEPQDTPWGARVFRVADPDGFILVVSTPLR